MRAIAIVAVRVRWGLAFAIAFAAGPAGAFPQGLNDWQARYGALSDSGDNARCQLCHGNANGGSPWNAYGWDILLALENSAGCDLNADSTVTNAEAFFCVEMLDSDGEGNDNATEIVLGTQPGWTLGPNNLLFSRAGATPGQLPPVGIGPIDPDGSEPPPPPPPPDDEPEPVKLKRTIVVKPGQSIQAALDRAAPGGKVLVLPGVYEEPGDATGTNALTISKSGIRLIGLSNKRKRVVLKSNGTLRNGIVAAPPSRTDCMSCHTDLAPPFPLRPGVPPGMPKETDPWIYDIEVRGITIQGFRDNGLFTEHVNGFKFIDVESIDNKNYGIFPTLSRNGLITHSRAVGADDSGIWVETSENVQVTYNTVEGNVNGFELSNSDDVLFAHNEVFGNTVGFAVLLLPDIFDDRAGAKRITVRNNRIYNNNKPNTARPGSILASVPPGTGILHLGPDDSLIEGNWIANHDFFGVVIADYCLAVLGTPFSCELDSSVTFEFVKDQNSANNRVVRNEFENNGTDPIDHPFDFAAADISVVTFGDWGNCFEDNVFGTSFTFFGFGDLPACD